MQIKPIITEKSLTNASRGIFTFRVSLDFNKYDIKALIEKIFSVNVENVRTINMPGKKYRLGKRWMFGLKNDWKKAIVTLKKGQRIDLFEVPTEETQKPN
jgi:large subunit ribosomal protein L23